jgi:precorrin isomerase
MLPSLVQLSPVWDSKGTTNQVIVGLGKGFVVARRSRTEVVTQAIQNLRVVKESLCNGEELVVVVACLVEELRKKYLLSKAMYGPPN